MATGEHDKSGEEVTPERHENKDPISGASGAHPVGVGIGAATLGVVGAAVGSLGGPIGAIAGAAAGAYLGGYGGKFTAEAINPTVEEQYWRENYRNRPYARADVPYDQYHRAYKLGWEGRMMYGEADWAEVEPALRDRWEEGRGDMLPWEHARQATQDAWHRIEHRDDPPAFHEGEHAAQTNEPGTAISGGSQPRDLPVRATTSEEAKEEVGGDGVLNAADGDGQPSESAEEGSDTRRTIH